MNKHIDIDHYREKYGKALYKKIKKTEWYMTDIKHFPDDIKTEYAVSVGELITLDVDDHAVIYLVTATEEASEMLDFVPEKHIKRHIKRHECIKLPQYVTLLGPFGKSEELVGTGYADFRRLA